MSLIYCEVCDKQVDTDKDAEHFDQHQERTAELKAFLAETDEVRHLEGDRE